MGKIETAKMSGMTRQSQDRFQELLSTHQRIVFKVANVYCGHPDERQDLIQEISVQLWRAFSSYDKQRPFSTWMYRIALNVAISFARKSAHRNQRLVALEDEAPDLQAEYSSIPHSGGEEAEFLHRFIAGLDELNKAMIILYLEENSYSEIAEILGITETNVATKISRLKQRIREESEKENL